MLFNKSTCHCYCRMIIPKSVLYKQLLPHKIDIILDIYIVFPKALVAGQSSTSTADALVWFGQRKSRLVIYVQPESGVFPIFVPYNMWLIIEIRLWNECISRKLDDCRGGSQNRLVVSKVNYLQSRTGYTILWALFIRCSIYIIWRWGVIRWKYTFHFLRTHI